ncbi:MAG TPA: terminase family protein [Candidatus Angelobacter sp.]|nr:terminase family protein [Candidatus Angelobacter sp.]
MAQAGTGDRAALAYRARPQQAALHRDGTRFKVIVAHRRFGKTVFAILQLLLGAMANRRWAPRYAYVAPFYRQAKAVAWDYLKYYGGQLGGARFHEGELRCDLPNGARISLYGADNPDSLRGLYLDGVVLDEFAQMDPRAWSEVIRPALADRAGWAIFIGTPASRNGLWQIYEQAKATPGWRALRYRAGDTGLLPAAELAAARQAMSEAEYAEEFECSFDAAIRGAYYGALIAAAEAEQRIGRVAHEPRLPVHTAWDLGVGDATAIWFFQRLRQEVRVIDYYESSGVGLDHYAKALQARGYGYGDHLLPHDARVQEMGSGKTRVETLQGLSIRPRVLGNHRLEDGINEARLLLPRCWFDAEKCARGLEALRHYRCEWDERRQALRDRPLHDWSSHAADAFRYLAMGLREPQEERMPKLRYDDRGIV